MRRIDAATLKGWIKDGQELAILDAREDGEFGKSHLFWANPCGLSPRRAARPARCCRAPACGSPCVDGGEGGLAERLAGYLEGIGCTDVAVLDGGTKAWAAAGYVLFSGMNVPSKAFGEWVEHHYHTPSVDPGELRAMIEGRRGHGHPRQPADGRVPPACPSPAPSTCRAASWSTGSARSPRTRGPPLVVNCAGRTRSIMGAESLRSAGVPNKVVALRNGTMGWELCRLLPATAARPPATRARVARDARPPRWSAPRPSPSRWGGEDHRPRRGWRRCWPMASRTTHVLDVRDPAEYAAGHLAGQPQRPGRAAGPGHR